MLREVFEREALPHMDMLYRVALSLTRNRQEAEDLLQDTYLTAFRFFDKFQPGSNCRAWLYRIMSNQQINRYHKRVRAGTSVGLDEMDDSQLYRALPEETRINGYGDPERAFLRQLSRETLLDGIREVPETFRVPVVLYDLEGFDYKEIAELIQCPVGTVRSRLARGRRILKKRLMDHARQSGEYTTRALPHD